MKAFRSVDANLGSDLGKVNARISDMCGEILEWIKLVDR